MCSLVSGNNSFHLEWNNHLGNMQAVLETLYTNQSLVDVTIACRDGVLKAHKVILSACSPYFEAVFQETPCKHPVLILKGVNVHEMQALLRFMYRGQVDVPEAELSAVIATACEFKVKGFSVDGLPGADEYRPDSASEHESETEAPFEDVQPRVLVRNWKADKKAEFCAKNSDKLTAAVTNEVEVTPVIVESQSLQDSPAPEENTPEEKGEDKEEDEDKVDEEEVEEEVDKKPNAEELAASLQASNVVQSESEEGATPSPNANTDANASTSATTTTSANANASASGSTSASSSSASNATSVPVASSSSSSASTSNSAATANPANANNGEATPYRRETRYKGQKRVDVGIRQPVGRPRSVDKRESSGGAESRTSGHGSAKKLRVSAPPRKSDLVVVPEHSLPSLDRIEEKKLILESPSIDISITRAGSSMFEDGPPPFVKIKAEAESADEEEDDEEATADMFCIPHLQELPDPDGADPSLSREELDITPRWSVQPPPPSASGREQRTVVEAPAEEGKGDMACPYCFTRCPRFSDLKRHMRLHTEDKPHECEFCSLAFARASHLARHRRTHTGERPFRCPAPSCERTFSRQDKLKLHTQRAHPGLPCDLVQSGTFMRIRGRRRIRDKNIPLGLRLGITPSLQPSNSTSSFSAASSSQLAPPAGPAVISLPFGDTSYLTSLSLGQQRYSDLTISPVTTSGSGSRSFGGSTSSGAGAEELLKSVRQLGECTIQTLPSKVLAD